MINPHSMKVANEIAVGLEAPDRAADVHRYHKILIEALNATHDSGEQDVMAVVDGFAHTLAQLLGGFDADTRRGFLTFIVNRAEWLTDAYVANGNIARLRRRE